MLYIYIQVSTEKEYIKTIGEHIIEGYNVVDVKENKIKLRKNADIKSIIINFLKGNDVEREEVVIILDEEG